MTARPVHYSAPPGSRAAYGPEAPSYDRRTAAFQSIREHRRGASAGAGRPGPRRRVRDGAVLRKLLDAVGPTGRVVGIDESPEMTELAPDQVAGNGWANVDVVTAHAHEARIDGLADAALLCAAHDVMQSPDALGNVVARLRPGAWIAAGGSKLANAWLVGLNLQVRALHEPYITDFTGFERPWTHLQALVPSLRVEEVAFGTGYCAVGQIP